MYATMNYLRLCQDSAGHFILKMIGTSCTDDARVNLSSFYKKSHYIQYEIFHRDAIHLYFCLFVDVSDCHD